MSVLATIYDDSRVTKLTKRNCKDITRNVSSTVIDVVYNGLKTQYTNIKRNEDAIFLKVDKKKTVEDVMVDIKAIIRQPVNINMLFRIFKVNNEIIIKSKRGV